MRLKVTKSAKSTRLYAIKSELLEQMSLKNLE